MGSRVTGYTAFLALPSGVYLARVYNSRNEIRVKTSLVSLHAAGRTPTVPLTLRDALLLPEASPPPSPAKMMSGGGYSSLDDPKYVPFQANNICFQKRQALGEHPKLASPSSLDSICS